MENEITYLLNLKKGPYEGPFYSSDPNATLDHSRDSNQYTLFRLTSEYYNTNDKNIQISLARQIMYVANKLREEINNGYKDNPDLPSSISSLRHADSIIRIHQDLLEPEEM